MYSNQNIQIPLSQSNCDIQTHLAEELNTRLTTSGSSATGQSAAYTVNYFLIVLIYRNIYTILYKMLLLIELDP